MQEHILKTKPSLAVALDNIALENLQSLVDDLQSVGVKWLKIGLELYTKGGSTLVKALKKQGFCIFLDLKFHDIPNTVFKAVQEVAALDVDLLTVHCAGGPRMLEASVLGASGSNLKVVGVTVLTSLDTSDFQRVAQSFGGSAVSEARQHCVQSFAKMASECALAGIVCSVPDLVLLGAEIKKLPWKNAPIFVTPGIREMGAQLHDQSSVATPEVAVKAGSTLLVVGRPILSPSLGVPKEAAQHFLKIIGN